jgi:hypothetical protein
MLRKVIDMSISLKIPQNPSFCDHFKEGLIEYNIHV